MSKKYLIRVGQTAINKNSRWRIITEESPERAFVKLLNHLPSKTTKKLQKKGNTISAQTASADPNLLHENGVPKVVTTFKVEFPTEENPNETTQKLPFEITENLSHGITRKFSVPDLSHARILIFNLASAAGYNSFSLQRIYKVRTLDPETNEYLHEWKDHRGRELTNPEASIYIYDPTNPPPAQSLWLVRMPDRRKAELIQIQTPLWGGEPKTCERPGQMEETPLHKVMQWIYRLDHLHGEEPSDVVQRHQPKAE